MLYIYLGHRTRKILHNISSFSLYFCLKQKKNSVNLCLVLLVFTSVFYCLWEMVNIYFLSFFLFIASFFINFYYFYPPIFFVLVAIYIFDSRLKQQKLKYINIYIKMFICVAKYIFIYIIIILIFGALDV